MHDALAAVNAPHAAAPTPDIAFKVQMRTAMLTDRIGRDRAARFNRVGRQPPRSQFFSWEYFQHEIPMPARRRRCGRARVNGMFEQNKHVMHRIVVALDNPSAGRANDSVVLPGSTQTFYRARRLIWLAACLVPLLLLGGAWWALNALILTPRAPGATDPAAAWVAYIVHDKGLVQLSAEERERFLKRHTQRWVSEPEYRDQFAVAVRRSTSEERAAFRTHLFDSIKPLVMVHIRSYHALAGDARAKFVDERIVEYNRMGSVIGSAKLDKAAFGDALPGSQELMQLLLTRTSDEERALGAAYFAALTARVTEIQNDPALKSEFERRILAPD